MDTLTLLGGVAAIASTSSFAPQPRPFAAEGPCSPKALRDIGAHHVRPAKRGGRQPRFPSR